MTEQEREQELIEVKEALAEHNRQQILDVIRRIKEGVDLLLVLLPDEQGHTGSECQAIDSAANALYHKYVSDKENE